MPGGSGPRPAAPKRSWKSSRNRAEKKSPELWLSPIWTMTRGCVALPRSSARRPRNKGSSAASPTRGECRALAVSAITAGMGATAAAANSIGSDGSVVTGCRARVAGTAARMLAARCAVRAAGRGTCAVRAAAAGRVAPPGRATGRAGASVRPGRAAWARALAGGQATTTPRQAPTRGSAARAGGVGSRQTPSSDASPMASAVQPYRRHGFTVWRISRNPIVGPSRQHSAGCAGPRVHNRPDSGAPRHRCAAWWFGHPGRDHRRCSDRRRR